MELYGCQVSTFYTKWYTINSKWTVSVTAVQLGGPLNTGTVSYKAWNTTHT